MPGEQPPGPSAAAPERGPESEETRLLRAEVQQQRDDARHREEHEAAADALKNRVSVAAIILTTALSFIGNVKNDRSDASSAAKSQAEAARRQGAELWAYYQTKLAERTSLELARDRVRLDLARRGRGRRRS